MKKLISLILALTLCSGFCVPAFAEETSTSLVQTGVSEIVLDETTKLIVYDFDNGDAQFSIVESGATVYTSYVDRQNRVIKETDHKNETTVLRSYADVRIEPKPINPRYSYTNVGRVTYKL